MSRKATKRWEKPSPSTKHALPCHFRDLKQKWKNLWVKRRENNLLWHAMTIKDAEAEATNFVAREIYVEDQREKNKASQLPMFAPIKSRVGVADTEVA